jgi:TolB protein
MMMSTMRLPILLLASLLSAPASPAFPIFPALPTVPALLAFTSSPGVAASTQSERLGLFTASADIGGPAITGSAALTAASGQYRITGAGANIWAKQDQFQFVWREMTGNFAVTTTISFVGEGAEHRKAGIMVRQSLDADATYADVVVHGSGMPALQWRSRKGEDTNTFDLPIEGPGTFTVKLVRTGVRMYMFLGRNGAPLKEIAHTEVSFQNPVLVGLAVCSHDATVAETALFTDVSIEPIAAPAPAAP